MKKLIYILIAIILCPIYGGAYNYMRTEHPPVMTDSNNISLYRYYVRNIGLIGHAYIEFLPNYTYTYFGEYSGQWRISADTLFLYEDYFWEGAPEDVLEYLVRDVDSTTIDYQRHLTSYRATMQIDCFSDYPFAGNVTAYKIHNYGESLVSIVPDLSFGENIDFHYVSKKSFTDALNLYGVYQMSYSAYSILSGWRNRQWTTIPMQWENGEFCVKDILRIDGKIMFVDLERDSITYHVVNPKYYLKNDPAKLYDKNDEKALTEWMSEVKVGETYKFRLLRPAYPTDSLANIPKLNTGSNSLCIGETEAYGYFFARLIK